ncbi:MAG: hypothetical protein JW836_05200 [Deltaproteobacteria bacterium]|nr:hypothetical protein [Deltaproteobacteria bacterium]
MTKLLSRPDYERWLYAIPAIFASVRSSTLRFFTTSAATGLIQGSVFFHNGYELRVSELADFATGDILDYGYEVWQTSEKLYWYDPQPHPDDPTLAGTFPHHKHIPPDIKHHRVPAPELSFTKPNLPFLIREVEQLPR